MTTKRKGPHDGEELAWAAELADWSPPPSSQQAQIHRRPAERFANLLDLDLATCDELPPLWAWFYFTDTWRQSDLGADGHPTTAPFYPPIWPRVRMFAGGRLSVHRNLVFDETVTRCSDVVRAEIKDGKTGPLAFVTVRHRYIDARGETALAEEQDHVYRMPPTRPEKAPVVPAVSAVGDPQSTARLMTFDTDSGEVGFNPDPVALFLFSAITHNAHRIHYDLTYATAIEGYPGLVVHGPLLALLMLEVRRRAASTPLTGTFEYRLRQPAFAGQHLTIRRSSDEVVVRRPADGAVVASSVFTRRHPDDV